jgi:zinc D-Ala-D-Ala carboxypeptidase
MKYFKIREFDSPDVEGSGSWMNEKTLELLDEARGIAGIPFVINSGYRTKNHNLKVGGVSNSAHLKGYAVDLECKNAGDAHKIITAAFICGFNRVGISKSFIHLDNDPSKNKNRVWTY